jgi:hypothetical protein
MTRREERERHWWFEPPLNAQRCPVCGSKRASCATLKEATRIADMWCPELERALDRAPSRNNGGSHKTMTAARIRKRVKGK